MKQKLVRVPFNVELAKKITSGDIDGRIVTRNGQNARILCFDRKGTALPIIALVEIKCGVEDFFSFYVNGRYDSYENNSKDLMLEIPEYTTFKDGDVIAFDGSDVLILCAGCIRKIEKSIICKYYAFIDGDIFRIVPKGCEFELINSRFATEEEKQKLIDALKESKEPKAKEYLKRFFGIEVKQEYEFKPFDKVLVRDGNDGCWHADIFSHKNKDRGRYYCTGYEWRQCIPYNEQTAHLLGTTEDFKP